MTVQNVGTVERWLRGLGGAGAAIVGLVWLLAGPGAVLPALLAGALVVLGIDFVVTGIRGYCPLYQRLGWNTARQAGRQE